MVNKEKNKNLITDEDIFEKVNKLNKFEKELNLYFIGLNTVIKDSLLAILIKEHILLEGKPGTAKSQLAKTIINNIRGAKVFQIQLSKFMPEDYVFGSININKLKNEGIIYHNTENSIVESDFAFIDEFFDGSDVLLRSLLEILNERTFTRNKQKLESRLNSAFLTSNYKRENAETAAILDRILFKHNIEPIEDINSLKEILGIYLKNIKNSKSEKDLNEVKYNGYIRFKYEDQIEFEELKTLQDYLFEVNINVNLQNKYLRLVKEFSRQTGKYISTRTINKGVKVLMAGALMDLRKNVNTKDFYLLKSVFTENLQQGLLFDTLVESVNVYTDDDYVLADKLYNLQKEFDSLKDLNNEEDIKEFIDKLVEFRDNELYKSNVRILTDTFDGLYQEANIVLHNIHNILSEKLNAQGE
jgi:MoxR-like ATPase